MIILKINKLLKIIITLIVIGSSTGCMVGPDFRKPSIETPAHFKSAELEKETAVNLKWWELFKDPVLNSLVTSALNDNKDVRIAASRIQEARFALGFTKADMYPRLDLESEAFRGNTAGGRRLGFTDDNFFIAPALSWELDFWGKFRRATESSRAELMASEYSLRAIQISLIAEVVSTYYRMLDFHQRLEISKHTFDSRLESLKIIEKRFSHGIIPEIDVNQAQIQKETAATAIPVFERLISKAEHTLSILLGRFPGEVRKGIDLYNQPLPPDIPVGLTASLLERRPDIVQAEYSLKAQNARIGVAQALRLPSINLTGMLGGASDELSTLTSGGAAWSISGGIFGPIFNFKQDKMRVEVEKERTKQARYDYENTILSAFREVEDALTEIQTYKKQVLSIKRKFKAAKNAAALSKMRYNQGFTSFLEVQDTERVLFDVALEHSEVNQLYHNAYVKLYKALGGGWLSESEMDNFQKTTAGAKK
jgi:multidrug efflux system outer membrane protein